MPSTTTQTKQTQSVPAGSGDPALVTEPSYTRTHADVETATWPCHPLGHGGKVVRKSHTITIKNQDPEMLIYEVRYQGMHVAGYLFGYLFG